ncbi:MAG: hypothetical protein ACYSYV_09060 [Planctomycetota bacterium]|jgi:hypothetical protein
MADRVRPKTFWLLRVELVALAVVACICVVKEVVVRMDGAEAGVLRRILMISPGEFPAERTVTAIFYSEGNPSAVIGDERTVRETDMIHGAKVVKIYGDKVEFEKDGRSWTQKVRERPAAYWK